VAGAELVVFPVDRVDHDPLADDGRRLCMRHA